MEQGREGRFIVVGLGRLGLSLLRTFGERVVAAVSRTQDAESLASMVGWNGTILREEESLSSIEADALWIVVPDDLIASVPARYGRERLPQGVSMVIHSSGVLGLDALREVDLPGVRLVAAHPNLILTGEDPLPSDTIWGVTGEEEVVHRMREIVGIPTHEFIKIPGAGRPLYHAAATMVANYPVTLIDRAEEYLRRCGVEPGVARRITTRYLEFVLNNVRAEEPSTRPLVRITGPVARGDEATLQKHLQGLDNAGLLADRRFLEGLIAGTEEFLKQLKKESSTYDR